MKVKLLIDLKANNGSVIKAGTVFSEPVPEFIMKRVHRRQAEIIEVNTASVHVSHALKPGGKDIPAEPMTKAPVAETVIPAKSISEKSNKTFGGQSDESKTGRKSENSKR